MSTHPSQTISPNGDQVFKHVRLWGGGRSHPNHRMSRTKKAKPHLNSDQGYMDCLSDQKLTPYLPSMTCFKLPLPIVPSGSLWMGTGMLLFCGKGADFTIALCTYSSSIAAGRDPHVCRTLLSRQSSGHCHQINLTIYMQFCHYCMWSRGSLGGVSRVQRLREGNWRRALSATMELPSIWVEDVVV